MPELYSSLKILGLDHVEFAVKDVNKASEIYVRLGFEKALVRKIASRELTSYLFVQNDIRVLLTQSNRVGDPIQEFVKKHGDGVFCVALLCEDAIHAFQLAQSRGAKPDGEPKTNTSDFGAVSEANICTLGGFRHRFVSRQGTLFLEGFTEPLRNNVPGQGLQKIDHWCLAVENGQLKGWVQFYESVLGLKKSKLFESKTGYMSHLACSLKSPEESLKIVIRETVDKNSKIQEFIDVNHGPGVQSLTLLTNHILKHLPDLKKQGVVFEETPTTYYEQLPNRLPYIEETLFELEKLQLQIDGNQKGYLLQIATHPVVGPFFYQIIQRKNHEGFGEGNFQALYDSSKQDQIRRGFF